MGDAQLVQLCAHLVRKVGEKRRDDCLVAACTDDILCYPLTEDGVYSVYKYGLTCSRFAREHIEVVGKGNGSFLDYGKIFYIKLTEHQDHLFL